MSKESIVSAPVILVLASDLLALTGQAKVYVRWTQVTTPENLETQGHLARLVAQDTGPSDYWVSFDKGNLGYAWVTRTRRAAAEHRASQYLNSRHAKLARPVKFNLVTELPKGPT